MTLYDTTFILNPQMEETGLDEYIKNTRDQVGRYGGKVLIERRIGMRRLAYEIQKLTQGYYVSFVFEGDGQTVRELERHFRLDENCLRFLTCLASKKVIDKLAAKEAQAAEKPPVPEEPAEPVQADSEEQPAE